MKTLLNEGFFYAINKAALYICNMTIPELYKIYLQHPSVKTDTRQIEKGDIFFSLKGPNFNGNEYAFKALEAGAAYCVCDEVHHEHPNIIQTNDVLNTLQQLALYHRKQFGIPFIAITGSNGKTTTKELVHEVLKTQFKCYTTKGNFNNHIGIPLTILAIKPDAEIAVVEMGANHLKEIESYCTYTLPTHGLITNCGKAHLEGFGSEEGIRQGKGELYMHLLQNNGTVFLNSDLDYLREMSAEIKNKITYGGKDADYIGIAEEGKERLHVNILRGANIHSIHTKLAGNYNLPNAMAAVCIGKYFGIKDENIKQALEEYIPVNSRSQIIKEGTNTILLDAYNANPSSMIAAIENFAGIQSNKKIVVLGGMKELGEQSIQEHHSIIKLLQKYSWEKVVLVGEDYTNLPDNFIHFKTSDEAAVWYKQHTFSDTYILIKGSRGMAMEKLLK